MIHKVSVKSGKENWFWRACSLESPLTPGAFVLLQNLYSIYRRHGDCGAESPTLNSECGDHDQRHCHHDDSPGGSV